MPDTPRQFDVRHPPVCLQFSQNHPVDRIELGPCHRRLLCIRADVTKSARDAQYYFTVTQFPIAHPRHPALRPRTRPQGFPSAPRRPISGVDRTAFGGTIMGDTRHTRLLIIGSGPAGYTAAVYASRAMLEPVLIQGIQPGGQLTITTEVENWPGDTEVQGPDLMVRMEAHAKAMGAEVVSDIIASLDLSRRPFVAQSDCGTTYTADAVILATGAQAKWLGMPVRGEVQGLRRLGLRHLRRLLLSRQGGRGDRRRQHRRGRGAVPDQLRLQGHADPSPRHACAAERSCKTACASIPRSTLVWNKTVEEIIGDEAPLGRDRRARARHADRRDERSSPAPASSSPSASARPRNWSRTSSNCTTAAMSRSPRVRRETSIPGVFAAGDLTDHIYRQAVTSAGMGCMAALDAERWLATQGMAEDGVKAAE